MTTRRSDLGEIGARGEMLLDIDEILEFLPHRYPFLLVDRVDELVVGEHIRGRKNVSVNEPYFEGHFPNHPIVPGVLIVESLAQLCGILAFKTRNNKPADGYVHYLAGVDNVRFKRPVRPGDTIQLFGRINSERRSLMKFSVEASVDDETVCVADLLCVERQISS